MSIQSKASVQKQIRALREIVENTQDPILLRIAYSVENALRWAIEDTRGWDKPEHAVVQEAETLKMELSRGRMFRDD